MSCPLAYAGEASGDRAADAAATAADAAEAQLLQSAELKMRQGRAAQAYALLAPQEDTLAGHARYDYLLGIAAVDSGHVTRAIFALERLVATRPQDGLAHAELARAYLAAGESESAREQLRMARQGPIPPEAARTIDRVLGAIEEPKAAASRTAVRGYIDVGLGSDSNLNSATANGQFALPAFGGIVFTLDPSSQRRSGRYLLLGAGTDLQTTITGPWSLVASVNARQTLNEGNHDLQQRQGDASVGVAWAQGADTITTQLQSSTFWLDSARYRSANGFSSQWQHALPEAAQVSGFVQWSALHYPGQDDRDARRTVAGVGYAKAFGPAASESAGGPLIVAYGSVYGVNERATAAGVDNYSHDGVGARAGVEHRNGKLTVFGSLQYESRRYGGPEPFFDTTRRDRQTDVAVGARYELATGWRAVAQLAHTRSASNVVLYDYQRTVFQVLLRREFN